MGCPCSKVGKEERTGKGVHGDHSGGWNGLPNDVIAPTDSDRQAIDIIVGGVKVNALPEVATGEPDYTVDDGSYDLFFFFFILQPSSITESLCEYLAHSWLLFPFLPDLQSLQHVLCQ